MTPQTYLRKQWMVRIKLALCQRNKMSDRAGEGSSSVETLKNYPIIGRRSKDNFLNSVAAQGHRPGLILYEETSRIKKKKEYFSFLLGFGKIVLIIAM